MWPLALYSPSEETADLDQKWLLKMVRHIQYFYIS